MSTTSLAARLNRLSPSFPTLLGNAALILGLWLALIHFPAPPSSGLDPSWRMAIGYGAEHGWQFGTDVVFTYGPLGYVLASTNSGGLHVQHLIWQLGANLIFVFGIWWFGRAFAGWRRTAYYLYLFVFGVAYNDAFHMIVILFLACALARDRFVGRSWFGTLLAAGMAVMALVKFTNFLLATVAIASLVGFYAWRKRWIACAVVGGGFLVAFLGGWALLGQSLANLPAYVANSISLSNGYVEAMGLDESGAMLAMGLGAGLALVGYFALTLYRSADPARSIALAAIAMAALFLNWKHGFVRADGHVLAHFVICLFFVFTYPVLLRDAGPLRRTKAGLLALSAACSIAGIWINSPVTILYSPSTLNNRMVDNGATVLAPQKLLSTAREQFAAAQRMFDLPGIKAVVGSAPVDVFGNEHAYAILNGLNLRARPALQSYAAYNERLEKLDADFMASPRAPEFVIQRINGNTVDNRMPSPDDALATRYLYHHYSFMMEEHDFLVWKRIGPNPALDVRKLLSSSTARFGSVIAAPDAGDAPVWCQLDIEPSFLGRLRTFFYKSPVLHVSVTDGGGNNAHFRLVRGEAQTGFLVYPHFMSNYNVVKFEEGGPGPRIASLSVELAPELRKFFQRRIAVRFYQLPPFPRSLHKAGDRPDSVRYRLFSQIPTNVSTPYPPEVMTEGGKEVMLTHPPSSLEFAIAPTTHHLSGKFGFISRAYEGENSTDGAEFIIEWIDATDRTRTLFKRLLRPRDIVEDRGEQAFKIDLPIGPGRLLMRTTPGPANNIAFDWTYWTDVKFSE